MKLRILAEPHLGATYETIARVARAADELGFDAFFRTDHLQVIGEGDGLPGPTDTWITLGAIARETSRIRLGTLVTSATFRLPGPLAVAVAQVDQMSGGRVDLGLGTGWYETEHASYGIPFPPLGERFDRLEEQLEIITGLWETPVGQRFSYPGRHYQVTDSPALPKPVQRPRPPILIGGTGAKRTPRLAARFADEFNIPFQSVEVTAQAFERVQAACEQAGRTRPMTYSVAHLVCCGRDEAELRRRAEAIGKSPEAVRAEGLAGSPAEIVDRIGEQSAIGAERLYLQILDPSDLDQLELLAAEVMPKV